LENGRRPLIAELFQYCSTQQEKHMLQHETIGPDAAGEYSPYKVAAVVLS